MDNETNSNGGHDAPMISSESNGNMAMRPVFLGNLNHTYTAEQACEIFERPISPNSNVDYGVMPVDRVDLKKGYCFVFLKDAVSQEQKSKTERFVSDINGMPVPGVSNALRAEFARGDGRVKRKEDDRRQRIQPSDTLFVVNFHEETTKREDLKMLFEPYGELLRIEMKRNYAFVQFKSIDEATKAKEEVNGGKLDQSVLTVEYVAQQRAEGDRRDQRRGGGGRDRRGDDRRRPRYDDNRRDDFRRGDRDRRSPPRNRRSRSRSRSPPRYRSRSPRGRDYDDRRGGGRDYDRRRGSPDRRPRSPEDRNRGGDRGSRAGRGGGGVPGDVTERNGFDGGDRERMDRGDRGYRA